MAKKLSAVKNNVGGYDLMTERDSGNEVRILTGNKSREYWERMRATADAVLENLNEPESERSEVITVK